MSGTEAYVADDRSPREVVTDALLATKDDGPMMYVETQGDDDAWARSTADLAVEALRAAGWTLHGPTSPWVRCHGTQADCDYRCRPETRVPTTASREESS